MSVVYYRYYTPVSSSPREIHQQEHIEGYKLLAHGLHALYHIDTKPEDLDKWIIKGDHGKPYFQDHPDIHFNISHCKNLIVCAFDQKPVGVDAELPGRFSRRLAGKILSCAEQHFLKSHDFSSEHEDMWLCRFWTLKEAYVKKTGTGLTVPLSDISFTYSDAENDTEQPILIHAADPDVFCSQKTLPTGHVISLCSETDIPAIFQEII